MKKTILILTIVLVGVAALGLMAFSYADASGFGSGEGRGFSDAGHRGGKGPGPLQPYMEAAAAEILGLSVEELQAARQAGTSRQELLETAGLTPEEFKAALEAALPGIVAQALNDNAITQDQADRILENGLQRPHRRKGFGPLNPFVLEAAAEVLGMETEELREAVASGTRLGEIIENAGLSRLEFRMAIDEATADIVAQALEAGTIDENQAEKILENGLPLDGRCRRGHGHRDSRGPNAGNFPTVDG